MILDPDTCSVLEWTDHVSLTLDRYATVSVLEEPELWRDWAAQMAQSAIIAGPNMPDPYKFSDWRDWAREFNKAVPNYL